MIFLIDKINQNLEIAVYEDIADLTNRVEWQDVFEGKSLIVDESGVIYEWDSSKKREIGIVYNYSLIPTNRRFELIGKCLREYRLNGKPYEFIIKL